MNTRQRHDQHADTVEAGIHQIDLAVRRVPAHGDHHRHPHRAKTQESQP